MARPLGESNEWQTTGQIVVGKIRAIITFSVLKGW